MRTGVTFNLQAVLGPFEFLIDIGTGVVLKVTKVTQYALYAMLGSPQSLTRWYFGLTVTSVGSGLIHTAVSAATLRPSSSFAYHVLRNNFEL